MWILGAAIGAWLLVAFAVEWLAAWAVRLARRPPPPCFGAAPRPLAADGGAQVAFLGDLQRGISDVALPLARELRRRDPALLVSSGDFVAHAEAPYYATVADAFARAGIETPVRAVPGNHDLFPRGVRDPTAGYALFRAHLGEPTWAVRVGKVLVVGLDDALGPVTGAQMAWLERTLEEHGDGPWIAVCHRPPRHLDRSDAPPQDDLHELVERLERRPPLLVVSGHEHEWRERVVGGVPYVVNAHGGDVHGLGLRRGPFELLWVTIDPDGSARWERSRHRRRPWLRVYLHQLAVRCWWSRRRRGGALLTAPAALLLGALGARAPLHVEGISPRPPTGS